MMEKQLSLEFVALATEYPQWALCRVVLQEKGQYRIAGSLGEQQAVVSGKFQYEAQTPSDYPAVGDYVMADWNQAGSSVIHRVLHRKSVFLRKAAGTGKSEQVVAANIDTVFLCMSLNNDFNLRRLERYLTIAWDSGATPVVVLTKADLCRDVDGKRTAVETISMGADLIVISAMEQDGYRQILPYLTNGKTVAFVGSSGVGKSTLINRLLGEERLETGGLRDDDKGHHTTTHRELLILPNGAMVIDTPGMREIGMWDSAEGLEKAFSDVEQLAASCRFKNCTHTNEPGCAVNAALADGTLSQERWQSYQKLRTENAYAEDAQSYLAAKEKKFKEISKTNKLNRRKKEKKA
ncbi:MAG: ribosome small subunit-dependent GTPase A [Oscillibacter sp.]|nr:ribosome small subunit-dependent GTPase A [Oscillibacter sp.]